MDKKSITTQELLVLLKYNPFREVEFLWVLGHRITSTHYWYFDSNLRCFMHTRDVCYPTFVVIVYSGYILAH